MQAYYTHLEILRKRKNGFEDTFDCHPLLDELRNRLAEIETLLAEEVVLAENNPEAAPISINELRIKYNFNRCEAIRGLLQSQSIRTDQNTVDRSLYPNLYTLCIQKLIQFIMIFKKHLNLNYSEYTVFSFWQLSYIKYPATLTKFIHRSSAWIKALYCKSKI